MAAPTDAFDLLPVVGAVALLLGGLAIAASNRQDRPALAFGLGLVAYGAAGTLPVLLPLTPEHPVLPWLALLSLAGSLALLAALVRFPRPVASAEQPGVLGALALVVVVATAVAMLQPFDPPPFANPFSLYARTAFTAAMLLAALVLPLRYLGEGGPTSDAEQRATAAVAAGLGLLAAGSFGATFASALRFGLPVPLITSTLQLLVLVVAIALWVRATFEATVAEARRARLVAAVLLVGLVLAVAVPATSDPPLTLLLRPLLSLACASLVAYALLGPWRAARRQA